MYDGVDDITSCLFPLQENCTLVYTADKEQGYFAVAIQVEDYIPGSEPYISDENSLSSVPLQFLVLVYQANTAVPCNSKPELIYPTPTADSCITLIPGETHKFKLVARVQNGMIGWVMFMSEIII